jgi:tetratricopeptide (TPR) repeat protein
LKTAIGNNQGDSELNLALLRISRVLHNDKQAQACLDNVIKQSADNIGGHIAKGEAYLAFNDMNNSGKEFKLALDKTKNAAETLNLAEIFIIDRSYSAAEVAVNTVLKNQPDNLKAKRLSERIKSNKEQAISKYRVAESFYKGKQRIPAIEAYRDALALDPCLAEAHLGIAKAFEHEGYYYDAMEHYKAYITLVDSSIKTGKYESKVKKLQNKINKTEKSEKAGTTVQRFSRI